MYEFEFKQIFTMKKDELWVKMYEKYYNIFNDECDEMEEEGMELMKEYFYADILPA